MADWIFSSEEYTQLYHQYFQQFLDSADCAAVIERAYALIAPYVEQDPTKFCAYEEFEAGVSALKAFCRLRAESVSGQLSGSIPSTDEGQSADRSVLVDTSSLTLSDMGTMGGGGGFHAGAFGGGAGGDRRTPEQAEVPDGFADGGLPGGSSAGLNASALALMGLSALVLLAGLVAAFQFKRSGGARYGKTHSRSEPAPAALGRERRGAE